MKFPYVVTADDAFPLGHHLMKPYGRCYPEHTNCILNCRLSCARRVSKNTFGISAAIWWILKHPIDAMPERCVGITSAVVALQNCLMFHKSSLPGDETCYVDAKDKIANIVHGAWRGDVVKDTGHLSLCCCHMSWLNSQLKYFSSSS